MGQFVGFARFGTLNDFLDFPNKIQTVKQTLDHFNYNDQNRREVSMLITRKPYPIELTLYATFS